MARMRARRMSSTLWVTKAGLRGSAISPARLRCDPQPPLHHAEQQDAAIRGDASAVEGGDQLLAANGWKTKRQDRIGGHGGCGSMRLRGQDALQLSFFVLKPDRDRVLSSGIVWRRLDACSARR